MRTISQPVSHTWACHEHSRSREFRKGHFSRERSQLLYPRVTTVALLFINSTPNEVSAIPCVLFGNPLRALFLKNRDFFCYGEIFVPNTRGPLGCLLGFWLSGPKPCGGKKNLLPPYKTICFFFFSLFCLLTSRSLSNFERSGVQW